MNRVYLDRGAGAWTEVVTFGSDDVRFNFVFDNLENPTQYVSENSYALRLPRCAANNAFFGQSQRLDSMIAIDSDTSFLLTEDGLIIEAENGDDLYCYDTGSYDPTQKMRYMVTDSAGLVISTGDAVVSEITEDEFILSLVGSQGRIFSRLLNAGYDTEKASEDAGYYLMKDWLRYTKVGTMLAEADIPINKSIVYASWAVDNPLWDFSIVKTSPSLKTLYGLFLNSHVSEVDVFIASIVGFTPTSQGRPKGFSADKWVKNGVIAPVFDGTIDVGDGTIEAQMQEYRSYNQQPFIYVWRLWQLFAEEFKAITEGYELNLDGRWFNISNQELAGMVYMLPNLYTEAEAREKDTLIGTTDSSYMPDADVDETVVGYFPVTGLDAIELTPEIIISQTHEGDASEIATKVSIRIDQFNWRDNNYTTAYWSYFTQFLCELTYMDADGNTVTKKLIVGASSDEDEVMTLDGAMLIADVKNSIDAYVAAGYELVNATYSPWKKGDSGLPNISFSYVLGARNAITDISISFKFANDHCPFYISTGSLYRQFYHCDNVNPMKVEATGGGEITIRDNTRSGSTISLERLFKDIKPFDVLLQFSKLHHLMWVVDDLNMQVSVLRSCDYYSDCVSGGITDITKRVDVSRGVSVYPLAWTERNVVFNFDGLDTDGVKEYEDRHGVTYGSKRLITQSKLGNETKNLLCNSEHDTVKSSVLYSEVYATRESMLYTPNKLVYIESTPKPSNVSNGEGADVFGNFYYRQPNLTGLKNWISDDSPVEVLNNTFCWKATPDVFISVFPSLRTVSTGGQSVLFAPAREQYTDNPDVATTYLYDAAWKNYIEEVYNAQNKTLETYVHLPRNVFYEIRKRPIVYVDHMLYLITEVRGWSENNTVCRCRMRQITDITKLTT